jgi:hypothetical protein
MIHSIDLWARMRRLPHRERKVVDPARTHSLS